MVENANFNKMASNLSLDERQNLLKKLKVQSTMSSEPLYFDEDTVIPVSDIETQFAKLPWYYRVWYLILSIIKSKPPVKIFEDYLVSTLGMKAEEKAPGMYDYHRGLLLSGFLRYLEQLREASRFFYNALDISVNRDKGAFFAFLGSLEMPDIHKKLHIDTDPLKIIEENKDLQEAELRPIALARMENALKGITDEHRQAMYFNARSLYCLKELSFFLFDRITMAFSNKAGSGGEACSANLVRELLISLNNILLSLKVVPPMPLLESLFVFTMMEKSGDDNFDIDRETRHLLARAENSLGVIRDFNKRVPLTWIIRCCTRDMAYAPRVITGGEEWFVVYRDHWKNQIDSIFKNFVKDLRHKELINTFGQFLKGAALKTLGNTQTTDNSDGMPVREAFALSFLATFYSAVFIPDTNRYLRPILINGNFNDNEAKAEFAESYNNLIKLDDDIKALEYEISVEGDFGKRYSQAQQEMSSLPVKRRKIQIIMEDVSKDAGGILERATESARRMIKIVNGIMGNDTRGKDYSLANLNKIAGKDSQFTEGLEEVISQFDKMLKILGDIDTIEYGH